jgi:hypothetical protein
MKAVVIRLLLGVCELCTVCVGVHVQYLYVRVTYMHVFCTVEELVLPMHVLYVCTEQCTCSVQVNILYLHVLVPYVYAYCTERVRLLKKLYYSAIIFIPEPGMLSF